MTFNVVAIFIISMINKQILYYDIIKTSITEVSHRGEYICIKMN